MKCDFCNDEADTTDMIINAMRYHACWNCQNRVFKLIKRMIREYVKGQ
jgi:hypothetical protein